ncbi:phospholipase A [Aromatoleum aromaticum]|nr:phospholipase A [Aromatoleum aromaticum]NMG54728.1 hypothetical protein [Aromatoleum aromaticum]
MRIPVLAVAAAMLLGAPAARAEWLLAAFATRVVAGQPLNISIVRDASDELPLPDRLEAVIEVGEQRVAVELLAAGANEGAAFRRDYVLNWPEQLTGAAVVELADRGSSRLLLIAQEAAAPPGADVAKAAQEPVLPAATLPPAPALSVNEPMYFLVGGGAGRSARLQLSFKYRIFEPEGPVAELLPPLRGLHFGYTQTSVWDLRSDSKPFRDTSYRPSLFYEWRLASDPDRQHGITVRTGYEHESNGRDRENSRSLDTLFASLDWRHRVGERQSYVGITPKIWGYLDRDENPDIHRYRGYGELGVRFGRDDGFLAQLRLRHSTHGGSSQLDLSYPLSRAILSDTASYLHFQVFNGYGETLLDYNRSRGTQFRIGFSIQR